MSKSFNDSDADLDTATSNAAADQSERGADARYQTVLFQLNKTPKFTAEWFQLKEEEVKLRSNPEIKESSCNDLAVDCSAGDGGDKHFGEANVEKTSTLECNQHAISNGIGRSSTRNSPQAAIIGADDPKNDHHNVISGDLPGPFFEGSSFNKSDSPNTNESKEGRKVTGHIMSPPAHVQHYCDMEDEHEHPHTNSGSGIEAEAAIDTSPTTGDELSPVPLSLDNYASAGGHKSIENAAFDTLCSMNDEAPSPPLSIRFDDAAITEKLSRVDAATVIKSERPTSSAVKMPPAPKSIYTNQGRVPNEDVVPQSRSMQPELGINSGLFLSPPVSQTDATSPKACANSFSQAASNENAREEGRIEDAIVIPDAFLFQANAPVELRDVGVAELVEPDRSSFALKKHHACVVSLLFAASVIALGLTLHFTSFQPLPNEISETIVSSSSQPTFPPPSSQPSFLQPSLSIKYAIENSILQRNVTFDGLEDTNARVLALDWINNKDPMELVASASNLVQRYILVLLAYESNLGWLTRTESNGSECKWLGVECDKDGHVIKLNISE